MIDITKFCSPSDLRTYLQAPQILDGRTVASNGHILISMPMMDGYEIAEHKALDGFRRLLSEAQSADFKPFPAIKLPRRTERCEYCNGLKRITRKACQECDCTGTVEFSNDFNTYQFSCQSCDGDGEIIVPGDKDCPECNGHGKVWPMSAFVMIDGFGYHPRYLQLIISEPDLQYSIIGEMNMLAFKSGDAFGIIMPRIDL